MRQKTIGRLFAVFTAILFVPALAFGIDFTKPAEFNVTQEVYNTGGGISYLPSGDLLAFSVNYTTGPGLFLVDANRDGIPAQPVILLAQFDSSVFPDFVQASPSGAYALFGVSGSDSNVYRIDLATNTVTPLFAAPGNFDFTFIDETTGYLSANPGGFDPLVANEISLVNLSGVPTVTTVAEFFNTPSGAVTVNENGDLYYIKSTFLFPAPPKSFGLFKMTAAQLAAAAASGVPLEEGDAALLVELDGGYDIVYRNFASMGPELFFTTVGDSVYRYVEGASAPETFLTVNDPTFPALSALSVHRPFSRFDAQGPSTSVLGVSLTTDFFSTYSTLEIRSTSFDSDDDGISDTRDQCPADPKKSAPLACGCGAEEIDANFDGVVDCGLPRVFSKDLSPLIGGQIGNVLLVEHFTGSKVKYEFEFRGPLPKTKRKKYSSKINFVDFSKLKPGTYFVRFRTSQKVGRKTVKSAWSATQVVLRG